MTMVDRGIGPGAAPMSLSLTPDLLGRLMPMFLWLDCRGRIRAMGPTLAKIIGADAIGAAFVQHFTLRRARGQGGYPEALGCSGRRLGLGLADHPAFNLRGTAIELPGAEGDPGSDMLVNLSFGIHLSEAVRFFGLTEADFAATDLAIELLFLAEAKSAVLGELQALTRRLEEARREAESEALSDPLTGLANRRAFDAALDRALKVWSRGGRSFALLHLDLDFFKQVNDTRGHAAGDAVLAAAAQRLSEETRRSDLVARVGGDEFMIILRGPVSVERVRGLCERLIDRLQAPIPFEGAECHVSASIGAVIANDGFAAETGGLDANRLRAVADSALYASKHAGRGRCTIASP